MPLVDGGVQLEWQNGTRRLDVEIGAEGTLSYFDADDDGKRRTTCEKEDANVTEVLKQVSSVIVH